MWSPPPEESTESELLWHSLPLFLCYQLQWLIRGRYWILFVDPRSGLWTRTWTRTRNSIKIPELELQLDEEQSSSSSKTYQKYYYETGTGHYHNDTRINAMIRSNRIWTKAPELTTFMPMPHDSAEVLSCLHSLEYNKIQPLLWMIASFHFLLVLKKRETPFPRETFQSIVRES